MRYKAVKTFRYHKLTDKIQEEFRKETALLRQLEHPNILILVGIITTPRLAIVTEFMTRGSLHGILKSSGYKDIHWESKVKMGLDMARGMQYLHGKSIMHRDIKSHNMLIDEDWRVKVRCFHIIICSHSYKLNNL